MLSKLSDEVKGELLQLIYDMEYINGQVGGGYPWDPDDVANRMRNVAYGVKLLIEIIVSDGDDDLDVIAALKVQS